VNSSETAKKRPRDRSRRLAAVDFDLLEQKFFTVLKREANWLLDKSFRGKLCEEEAKDLSTYMSLLKKIKDDELKALDKLDTDKLEAIAKQGEQPNGKTA